MRKEASLAKETMLLWALMIESLFFVLKFYILLHEKDTKQMQNGPMETTKGWDYVFLANYEKVNIFGLHNSFSIWGYEGADCKEMALQLPKQ